jgi:hypothetical protein
MQCAHCKKTLVGKELSKELRGNIKKGIFNGKNTAPHVRRSDCVFGVSCDDRYRFGANRFKFG